MGSVSNLVDAGMQAAHRAGSSCKRCSRLVLIDENGDDAMNMLAPFAISTRRLPPSRRRSGSVCRSTYLRTAAAALQFVPPCACRAAARRERPRPALGRPHPERELADAQQAADGSARGLGQATARITNHHMDRMYNHTLIHSRRGCAPVAVVQALGGEVVAVHMQQHPILRPLAGHALRGRQQRRRRAAPPLAPRDSHAGHVRVAVVLQAARAQRAHLLLRAGRRGGLGSAPRSAAARGQRPGLAPRGPSAAPAPQQEDCTQAAVPSSAPPTLLRCLRVAVIRRRNVNFISSLQQGFPFLALHLHGRATAPARRQPLRLGAGRARRTASPWRDTSTTPASAPGRAALSATRQQNVRSRSEYLSFCCSPASTSPCAPHSLACCGAAEAGAAHHHWQRS